MNKKEIAALLNIGKSKSEVYKILSDKGENTHSVADLSVSIPNTYAYEKRPWPFLRHFLPHKPVG